MRFASIRDVSLVDCPGKIVSTVFVGGCNFNCPYCHNHELIHCIPTITEEVIINRIETSFNKKWIDGVCISGGEPSLYADELGFFVIKLKEKIPNIYIKIDTNGSNPEIFQKVQADFWALDLKTSFFRYKEFCDIPDIEKKIQTSFDYLIESKKDDGFDFDFEFRTTMYTPLFGIEEKNELADMIHEKEKQLGRNIRWSLQKCRET